MKHTHRHTHTFKFQHHQIRTVQRDNKTWFVTADVCTLGIDLHESLGKLEFLAGTIISLCDLAGEPFDGLDFFTIISMDKIISDATQEL